MGTDEPDEYREAIAHYWGYCTMQDDLLGLTLEALDALGTPKIPSSCLHPTTAITPVRTACLPRESPR